MLLHVGDAIHSEVDRLQELCKQYLIVFGYRLYRQYFELELHSLYKPLILAKRSEATASPGLGEEYSSAGR